MRFFGIKRNTLNFLIVRFGPKNVQDFFGKAEGVFRRHWGYETELSATVFIEKTPVLRKNAGFTLCFSPRS